MRCLRCKQLLQRTSRIWGVCLSCFSKRVGEGIRKSGEDQRPWLRDGYRPPMIARGQK